MKTSKVWCAIAIAATWALCLWISAMSTNYMTAEKLTGNVKNELAWGDTDDGMWVLYAQNLSDPNNNPSLNKQDNFGEGRPIGWSPTLAKALLLAGKTYQTFHPALTLNQAIERAGVWINPILLAIAGTFICITLVRLIGPCGLIFYGTWLLNKVTIGEFAPTHPDHQGVLLLCNIGLLFGTTWGMLENSKNWFRIAGIFGGLGIAFSAINALASWTFMGIATLIGLALWTPNEKSASWAQGWRELGWIASGISLLVWFIDRNGKFSMALEINGPLHSIAILGGAHLLAIATDLRSKKTPQKTDLGITLIGLTPLLLTTAIMREDFILSSDPFLKKLMWIIAELQPNKELVWHLYAPGVVAFILLLLHTWKTPLQRAPISSVLFLYGSAICLAITAGRFEAYTITLGTLLTCTVAWKISDCQNQKVILATCLLCMVVAGGEILSSYSGIAAGRWRPPGMDTSQTAAAIADLANTWEEKTGRKPIVLDPNPGRATRTLYYLKKGAVGQTIYWEATPAMKTTAAILANADTTQALRILNEKGVTHLVLQKPSEIGGILLAQHGRAAYLNANKSNFEEYSGAEWIKKNPPWLKKTHVDGVYEIDKKMLTNDPTLSNTQNATDKNTP